MRSAAASAERSPAPSSGRHPPLGISTARGTRAARPAPASAPARPRPPRVRTPGAPPPPISLSDSGCAIRRSVQELCACAQMLGEHVIPAVRFERFPEGPLVEPAQKGSRGLRTSGNPVDCASRAPSSGKREEWKRGGQDRGDRVGVEDTLLTADRRGWSVSVTFFLGLGEKCRGASGAACDVRGLQAAFAASVP